ncbi:Thiol-disulfide oxidoreductase ResA [Dyadobacter sp. CECT 9275]|uniref:Thiol-disulfide oxidoreductase ResA n=1 Tax=Dyadobacter helix TaxID=2822344 RepID=A0A916NNU9_9BACT|nr:TlpA disulfide reductase family protein [Dyadobacter sp. CECT 9275]CAG5017193.1 Thiol-disulfide oxidoreductase ResA [Dyadobacter sp. CECT 9275]
MGRLFYTVLLLLSVFSNIQAQNSITQLPDLTGNATLQIGYTLLNADFPVELDIFHSFPQHEITHMKDSLHHNRRTLSISCPVKNVENTVFLTLNGFKLRLLLVPGDTVGVILTEDPNVSDPYSSIQFQGKNQEIQAYYLAKKHAFPIETAQLALNACGQAEDLKMFKTKIDSLHHAEAGFWSRYQETHRLPYWFKTYESASISYSDARLRLYAISYQIDYQKKTQTIPVTYLSFLDQLAIQDTSAFYQYDYLNFLEAFIYMKAKGAAHTTVGENELRATAKRYLGKDLVTYFQLWQAGGGILGAPENTARQLSELQVNDRYKYLVAYLLAKCESQVRSLKKGDKAPTFFLADQRDSLVSLGQFKGEVVYLSFWFSSCGGCIHEMPFENKMVEKFRGQPVRIISISIDTDRKKWLAAIDKYNLKTINLIANPAWRETLESKYKISVYPHYTLIGADGNIIENFASRPSQNASEKIEKALAGIPAKTP